MKKARLILSASLVALAASTTIISCGGKDESCAAGYEGKNCDVEIREQLIGTFDAIDVRTATNETKTYTPTISKNATVTVVNIQEFGDFYRGSSELVTSNITKAGNVITFDIPNQKPDGEYTVSGKGTYDISSKKVAITYTLTEPESEGGRIINSTGNWTKR